RFSFVLDAEQIVGSLYCKICAAAFAVHRPSKRKFTMANVVLISLYDRNAYGQRLMSANLKRHGHQCHMIFLKRYDTNWSYELELEVGEYPWMGINERGRVFKYASNSHISDHELALLRELLDRLKPDVIGMTVNTPLRVQNIKVTRFIKEH